MRLKLTFITEGRETEKESDLPTYKHVIFCLIIDFDPIHEPVGGHWTCWQIGVSRRNADGGVWRRQRKVLPAAQKNLFHSAP